MCISSTFPLGKPAKYCSPASVGQNGPHILTLVGGSVAFTFLLVVFIFVDIYCVSECHWIYQYFPVCMLFRVLLFVRDVRQLSIVISYLGALLPFIAGFSLIYGRLFRHCFALHCGSLVGS